ncbi:hypothetical protein KAFR_0D02170 [Kazachstania africana CBS 2517]|uniref:Glycerol-3-phosphate dehydrogenase n=1 Tax=Kazachstania africana (strain ATCC 22294 / BCRC 22015 / CBS 2517 / CECT 1963 / NBRC 1671 / NRRL Y-8276) TaxID=1071382 RepID=H2AU14_KAZAF|nr:hypothetical protein KAFR_0D02170 [Kazachstania africana CBS 2517]CCF57864.1 hypothetical protein KAFR_0D02170 [Kazachstania africana CBS 2517]
MFTAKTKNLLPKVVVAGIATVTVGGIIYAKKGPRIHAPSYQEDGKLISPLDKRSVNLPTRNDLISKLNKTNQFDVLVIGGGATGAGCALDATTRGLNVALVEKYDFASGTSSKSTKMAHGGVRYLEKAFWELSKAQLDLVIEALNERAHLLNTAPHLCKILPIMIPVYNYWQIPYFYAGCKMYDLFAGSQNLKSSYLLSKRSAADVAPMLDTTKLKAGLVYHDGTFNDSRMNSTLAVTAIENGSTVLNYMEVKQLLKEKGSGKIEGAIVEDLETGKQYNIKAKVVINATGPYSDAILQMDQNPTGLPDPLNVNLKTNNDIATKVSVSNPKMVVPSAGVHIILPSFYCPKDIGLLDAKTSDGRVMFFLPWQGKVLAGTTDVPMKQIPENPTATEADIQDILKELQHYIRFPVKREDVLSAWAGIRPLVKDPRTLDKNGDGSTQGLVRSHFIFTSDHGLVTIAGGKWTTYRAMAEETVDEAIKVGKFANVKPCITRDIKLAGGENWNPNLQALLAQRYHLSSKLSQHLADNYGTRAPIICEMYAKDRKNKLPIALAANYNEHEDEIENANDLIYNNERGDVFECFRYPFTVGEVKYSVNYEYAITALDFLMRRSRFAFLDAKEAVHAVEGTVKIMGDELNWDESRRHKEIENTIKYIKTFGV